MKLGAAVLLMVVGSAATIAGAPIPALTPDQANVDALMLYHWWTSSSEAAAVSALVDVFKKQYPDVAVRPTTANSHGGGSKMFGVISGAAATGRPPDAFQVHAGAPLRPYLDGGLLNPIDEVWTASGLEKEVPPIIQTMSKIEGHYYSLPVNVHRTNLLWYNKALLDKHRIDPSTLTTWDAFFEAAEKLESAGVHHPVQVGVNWTASLAFESIMVSLGIAAYEDWINGKITAADDPRLVEAFGRLKKYLSHANPDHATTAWDVAIKRVIAGEAAFCIMGDWANGEFRLARLKYGKDYGAMPVPGTKGLYGVSIDGFAQTRGIANPANSNRWMSVAASREGQDAFNAAKGSISARADADVTKYDPYQRSAIADFKAARFIYPNLTSSTHDAFKSRLDIVMTAFAADLDVKKAAANVAAAAAGSQNKFSRAWSLK
jgi:glucose/mannose transport system substrate-binding protein